MCDWFKVHFCITECQAFGAQKLCVHSQKAAVVLDLLQPPGKLLRQSLTSQQGSQTANNFQQARQCLFVNCNAAEESLMPFQDPSA